MKLIDKIRKSTAEVVNEMKWPLTLKVISRAAESFEDAIESEKIASEQEIIDLRKKLTECKTDDEARKVWKDIAKIRMKLEETKKLAEIVSLERKELFAEAKDE